MPTPSSSPWRTHGPVLLMTLAGLLLTVIAFANWRSAKQTAQGVAAQRAMAYARMIHTARGQAARDPSTSFEELVLNFSDEQLTYAKLQPPQLKVPIELGTPALNRDAPGVLLSEGKARVSLYQLPPPPEGQESPPPRRLRPLQMGRPGAPHTRASLVVHPPPGSDAQRLITLEYDAPLETQLLDRARAVLVGSGIASLLLIGLSAGLSQRTRRAQEAEAALEEQRHLAHLGEMSAVLAHELRNPLASLKGHAQLLEEAIASASPMKPGIDQVVEDALRLEALTEHLLEFTRSSPLKVADTSLETLWSLATADLHTSLVPDLSAAPPSWPMDGPQLARALSNLLQNALDASEKVEVRGLREGGELILEVRDHGEGLPEESLSSLFEPFHTTKTRGTGLGLSIARRIVERHHGRITASNHPGGGALFRICLPPTGA